MCAVPVGKQLVAKVDKGKRRFPVRVHSPLLVSFLFCQNENLKSIFFLFFFLRGHKGRFAWCQQGPLVGFFPYSSPFPPPAPSLHLLLCSSFQTFTGYDSSFSPLHRPSTSSVAVFRPWQAKKELCWLWFSILAYAPSLHLLLCCSFQTLTGKERIVLVVILHFCPCTIPPPPTL